MQDIFNQNGHLTDYALKAIISGEPEELSRLEIAEHLSFCDDCLLRYTELISDDILLTPPESAAPNVMQKIKRTARIIFFNKYVTMTIAASIAMTLWITGSFTSYGGYTVNKLFTGIEAASDILEKKTSDISNGLSESVSSILEKINNKEYTDNEKK